VIAAAAASGLSKPDQFAAALALGLLSVAFIIALLLLCRNARCRCKGQAGAARSPPPLPPAERRTVINVTDASDGATAKVATPVSDSDAVITVTSTGGGFVLYTGEARGAAP